MKKFLVLILALVALAVCFSAYRADVNYNASMFGNYAVVPNAETVKELPKGSGSGGASVESSWEEDDFKRMMQEHANYNKLFRSVQSALDDDLESVCTLFDDYVDYEKSLGATLIAEVKDLFGLDSNGAENTSY